VERLLRSQKEKLSELLRLWLEVEEKEEEKKTMG